MKYASLKVIGVCLEEKGKLFMFVSFMLRSTWGMIWTGIDETNTPKKYVKHVVLILNPLLEMFLFLSWIELPIFIKMEHY